MGTLSEHYLMMKLLGLCVTRPQRRPRLEGMAAVPAQRSAPQGVSPSLATMVTLSCDILHTLSMEFLVFTSKQMPTPTFRAEKERPKVWSELRVEM